MDNQVAVKAVIRNDDRFLIVKEKGRWQAVGGRLDKGELLEEGLRRETKEETGITDLVVGKVVHIDEWFAKPEGDLKHIVALFYLCDTTTSDVVLSDEHQEYMWASVAEVESLQDPIEDEIKKAIILASSADSVV
mgnify:CR=1 FL=1